MDRWALKASKRNFGYSDVGGIVMLVTDGDNLRMLAIEFRSW